MLLWRELMGMTQWMQPTWKGWFRFIVQPYLRLISLISLLRSILYKKPINWFLHMRKGALPSYSLNTLLGWELLSSVHILKVTKIRVKGIHCLNLASCVFASVSWRIHTLVFHIPSREEYHMMITFYTLPGWRGIQSAPSDPMYRSPHFQ